MPASAAAVNLTEEGITPELAGGQIEDPPLFSIEQPQE